MNRRNFIKCLGATPLLFSSGSMSGISSFKTQIPKFTIQPQYIHDADIISSLKKKLVVKPISLSKTVDLQLRIKSIDSSSFDELLICTSSSFSQWNGSLKNSCIENYAFLKNTRKEQPLNFSRSVESSKHFYKSQSLFLVAFKEKKLSINRLKIQNKNEKGGFKNIARSNIFEKRSSFGRKYNSPIISNKVDYIEINII